MYLFLYYICIANFVIIYAQSFLNLNLLCSRTFSINIILMVLKIRFLFLHKCHVILFENFIFIGVAYYNRDVLYFNY